MTRYAVLLRGVNLGSRNRVSMPALRLALEEKGFRDVATYVQSGNAVLSAEVPEAALAEQVREIVLERFELDLTVIVRSRDELAAIVERNPIPRAAADPKHYLVTFLETPAAPEVIERLRSSAASHESFAAAGRELYSWHPTGVGRSPLWERLAARTPGIGATSRNWTTVSALLAMADGRAYR